jgi:hypothetical protein
MKQFFTWQTIGITAGTALALVGLWFASTASEAGTEFIVVTSCAALAAGAFITWAIRSFVAWDRSRSLSTLWLRRCLTASSRMTRKSRASLAER